MTGKEIWDVVLVLDKDAFKGTYGLAIVIEVRPGKDGLVKNVPLSHKNYKSYEKVHSYQGA